MESEAPSQISGSQNIRVVDEKEFQKQMKVESGLLANRGFSESEREARLKEREAEVRKKMSLPVNHEAYSPRTEKPKEYVSSSPQDNERIKRHFDAIAAQNLSNAELRDLITRLSAEQTAVVSRNIYDINDVLEREAKIAAIENFLLSKEKNSESPTPSTNKKVETMSDVLSETKRLQVEVDAKLKETQELRNRLSANINKHKIAIKKVDQNYDIDPDRPKPPSTRLEFEAELSKTRDRLHTLGRELNTADQKLKDRLLDQFAAELLREKNIMSRLSDLNAAQEEMDSFVKEEKLEGGEKKESNSFDISLDLDDIRAKIKELNDISTNYLLSGDREAHTANEAKILELLKEENRLSNELKEVKNKEVLEVWTQLLEALKSKSKNSVKGISELRKLEVPSEYTMSSNTKLRKEARLVQDLQLKYSAEPTDENKENLDAAIHTMLTTSGQKFMDGSEDAPTPPMTRKEAEAIENDYGANEVLGLPKELSDKLDKLAKETEIEHPKEDIKISFDDAKKILSIQRTKLSSSLKEFFEGKKSSVDITKEIINSKLILDHLLIVDNEQMADEYLQMNKRLLELTENLLIKQEGNYLTKKEFNRRYNQLIINIQDYGNPVVKDYSINTASILREAFANTEEAKGPVEIHPLGVLELAESSQQSLVSNLLELVYKEQLTKYETEDLQDDLSHVTGVLDDLSKKEKYNIRVSANERQTQLLVLKYLDLQKALVKFTQDLVNNRNISDEQWQEKQQEVRELTHKQSDILEQIKKASSQ